MPQAFNNESADVRKAVVFCLVDVYLVLGDELTQHLEGLTTAQLKLVTIYINRTLKERSAQLAAPAGGGGGAAANQNRSRPVA